MPTDSPAPGLVRGLQRCAVIHTDKFNSSILTVNNQVSDASLATG